MTPEEFLKSKQGVKSEPTPEEFLAAKQPQKIASVSPEQFLLQKKGMSEDEAARTEVLANQKPKTSIPKRNQFQDEEGWMNSVMEALDYAGNISRSGVKEIMEGDFSEIPSSMWQAAKKERYTGSDELLDMVGYENVGADDGKFQMGDIVDFGANFAVDLATDPLTWLTFGVGGMAKNAGKGAVKAAKAAKVAGVADEVALSAKATEGALKAASAGNIAAPLLGGVYGVGAATDSDSDLKDRLVAFGAGALAVKGAKFAAPFVKDTLKKSTNAMRDGYALQTRGAKFTNMSAKEAVAVSASKRKRDIAERILRGREDALEGLSPAERIAAQTTMEDLRDAVIQNRYKADPDFAKKIADKNPEQIAFIEEADRLFIETQSKPGGLIANKMDALDKQTREGVEAWTVHNENVMKELAQNRKLDTPGIKFHVPNIFKEADLEDLTQSVKTNGKEAEKINLTVKGDVKLNTAFSTKKSTVPDELADAYFQKWKSGDTVKVKMDGKVVKLKNVTDDQAKEILKAKAYDDVYGEYSERFAGKFLEKGEREALKVVNAYRTADLSKPVQAWENMLGGYDKINNLVKTQLLQGSMTWIKNNYFDNAMKAYVETGIGGLKDALGSPFSTKIMGLQKELGKDIKNIMNGNPIALATKDGEYLAKYNVLDGPALKALRDDNLDLMMKGEIKSDSALNQLIDGSLGAKQTDTLNPVASSVVDYTKKHGSKLAGNAVEGVALQGAKAVNALAPAGKLAKETFRKGWDVYYNKMLGSVGEFGARMEGKARAATWKRYKEGMVKHGMDEDTAAKVAADLTERTFFDYGAITHFEKSVLKRYAPFYSFYSKNLPYWADAFVDHKRIGRIAGAEKVRTNIGEKPTERQSDGLAPYLKESSARTLGRQGGGLKVAMMPTMSYMDAARTINPMTAVQTLSGYKSPVLNDTIEMVSRHDNFQDAPLYPSDMPGGKKYLFNQGHKFTDTDTDLSPVNLWDSAGQAVGGTVQVDRNGNPFTTSDGVVALNKLLKYTPAGLPIYDQILGAKGKIDAGKETLPEALINLLSPIRTTVQSGKSQSMYRKKTIKERQDRKKAAKLRERLQKREAKAREQRRK